MHVEVEPIPSWSPHIIDTSVRLHKQPWDFASIWYLGSMSVSEKECRGSDWGLLMDETTKNSMHKRVMADDGFTDHFQTALPTNQIQLIKLPNKSIKYPENLISNKQIQNLELEIT
ncbi:hypothetical protein HZ326_30497, partial [Fusarium oxysporum f. sp. albedinis]